MALSEPCSTLMAFLMTFLLQWLAMLYLSV